MSILKKALIPALFATGASLGASSAANADEGTVIGIYRDFGLIVRIASDKDQTFPCHTHIVVEDKYALPFDPKTCEPTKPISPDHEAELRKAFGEKKEGQKRKILVDVPQTVTIDNMHPQNCGIWAGNVRLSKTNITLADFMEKFGYKQSK